MIWHKKARNIMIIMIIIIMDILGAWPKVAISAYNSKTYFRSQKFKYTVTRTMVTFSSLARIWGECSTIHSAPEFFYLLLLFCLFFEVEISSRTLIPTFMPESVHSRSASWDDSHALLITVKFRITFGLNVVIWRTLITSTVNYCKVQDYPWVHCCVQTHCKLL